MPRASILPEGLLPAAAVYCRMSDDDQTTSIPQQREQIADYAKGRFRLVRWYIDEGKSGSKDVHKRVEFNRLLADAPKEEFSVVLCLDLSRFGRLDSIEGAYAKKILRDAGIVLHTLLDGEIDWRKTTDRIVDAVLSEAQHDYSVRLGQKTLKGKLDAFLSGNSFGFKCPYGFARKITDHEGKSWVVPRTEEFVRLKTWRSELIEGDSVEAEVVRWLFSTFATRDVGYRWLAADLNRRGVPSPTGKKWTPKVVSEVLKNEKYVGDTKLGKRLSGTFWRLDGDKVEKAATKAAVRNKEALIVRATHKGLVDRPTFETVQKKILRRQATGKHTKGSGGYMLKDVLHCGTCGKPLYGNPNRSAKKAGKVIYVCKTAITYGKQCECAQWSVKEEDILPFLKQKLQEGLDRKELEGRAHRFTRPKRDVAEIQKKLDALDVQIKQGAARLMKVSDDLFPEVAEQLAELKAERATLTDQRRRAQEAEDRAPWSRTPEWEAWMRETWAADRAGTLVRFKVDPASKAKYTAGFSLHKDAIRELLVSHGCRVDIWWRKRSAKRWEVAKIRVRLFGRDHDLAPPVR
ncbi:MAG TPA: recombinase family protein [Planctomycetaceae bacterium]